MKGLKKFYEGAEEAQKKAKADVNGGGWVIAIVLYSGHGSQGPVDAGLFEGATYTPHTKGPDAAVEPEDDLAPQNFQQLFLHDRMPVITNKKDVEKEFVAPITDFNTSPTGVLDWGYVFASVKRPAKLTSWVILQACQSGSATIGESGLKKKRLSRKIKSDKSTDAEKKAAKKELDVVVEESQKKTKKRIEKATRPEDEEKEEHEPVPDGVKREKKGKKAKEKWKITAIKDTTGGQGPVHYWTAVGPDINAETGPTSFLKVLQIALDATCPRNKEAKNTKKASATHEFGGEGEFRIKDVWNALSSVGVLPDNGGDEDVDLFGEDKTPQVRSDQAGFERMVGVDDVNGTKTRKVRRAQYEKEGGDPAKQKSIKVPNAPADWMVPFYSTISAGWEDMRLLQTLAAAARGGEGEGEEVENGVSIALR